MNVKSLILLLTVVSNIAQSAVIPKGISSLLKNSKVPTQEEIFDSNSNDEITASLSNKGIKNSNDDSDIIPNNKKSTPSGSFNFASLIEYQTRKFSDDNKTPKQKITALEHYRDTFKDFSIDYDSEKTSAILLSSEIIKNNTLKKLGIKGISFKLPVIGVGPHKSQNDASFLPLNLRSVFLFNLKDEITLDQSKLEGNIPLNLKGDFEVDDYSILIPISYMQSLKVSSIFLEEFLTECNNKILYYNKPLRFDFPLLITLISKSENDLISSISDTKPNPPVKLSSLFIDLISKNWLQSATKSIDILQSTFCFVNNNEFNKKDNNTSICVRLDDELKSIEISPSFDSKNKLNFNQMVASTNTLEKRGLELLFGSYQNKIVNEENNEDTLVNGLSFKIQTGNNTLSENNNAFKNISKCREEEDHEITENPLHGSLFGEDDNSTVDGDAELQSSASANSFSINYDSILLLHARPNYKQVVTDEDLVDIDSNSFSF